MPDFARSEICTKKNEKTCKKCLTNGEQSGIIAKLSARAARNVENKVNTEKKLEKS